MAAKASMVSGPKADYLRLVVTTVVGDATFPVEVHDECYRLMLAINSNDLPLVSERFARLHRLAAQFAHPLPPCESKGMTPLRFAAAN